MSLEIQFWRYSLWFPYFIELATNYCSNSLNKLFMYSDFRSFSWFYLATVSLWHYCYFSCLVVPGIFWCCIWFFCGFTTQYAGDTSVGFLHMCLSLWDFTEVISTLQPYLFKHWFPSYSFFCSRSIFLGNRYLHSAPPSFMWFPIIPRFLLILLAPLTLFSMVSNRTNHAYVLCISCVFQAF